MSDELDYLQPGFDPSSLTVPRIRSILVQYNIPYPSGAKKPQLVEIFQDNVLPQSKRILSARARARRTSEGITDADSQEIPEDEELMPPPPTPKPRSSRKPSSRVKAEESESDVSSSVRSPTKRTPRASKYAKASDTETGTDLEVKKSVRRSRKSEAPVADTPKPKKEDVEDEAGASRRQSNFTYDNPFQSGSSPPTDISSGERPRKSLGSSKVDKRKSTAAPRRRTEGMNDEASFEIPVSEAKWSGYKEPVQSIEPGEEFTPEEQLELTREQAITNVDPLPQRRQTPSRGISKGPIWTVLLTLLGGYAAWYRQEKIAVGYCGVGREAHAIVPANVQVPDWVKVLVEPECEPCPQHAYCSADLETRCETDFLLKQHPLSLGGLIPFTPTCEPDGEKVRRVKAVADRAIEELRERRAKFECGELVDEAGVPEPSVEIDAVELKKELSKKRVEGMSEAEFENLWEGAIGEIEGREEVESHVDGLHTYLSSTSLARLPFTCALRRSFWLSVARYRLQIASLATIALAILYIRSAVAYRARLAAAVPGLVSLTLDRLANQAGLHASDKDVYENWISIGQLRDDVLRDEHSIKKREALWSKVRPVVEMNANIRSAQRESRSGEISRVWEWIGAIDGDGGESRMRRKSGKGGRVSWGAYDENSSPVSGMDGGPKWEEGRPIY